MFVNVNLKNVNLFLGVRSVEYPQRKHTCINRETQKHRSLPADEPGRQDKKCDNRHKSHLTGQIERTDTLHRYIEAWSPKGATQK